MAMARAAAWYQLIDLKKLVRRAGLRFLPAAFRVGMLRFLVRLLDIELLACKLPPRTSPRSRSPTGLRITRDRAAMQTLGGCPDQNFRRSFQPVARPTSESERHPQTYDSNIDFNPTVATGRAAMACRHRALRPLTHTSSAATAGETTARSSAYRHNLAKRFVHCSMLFSPAVSAAAAKAAGWHDEKVSQTSGLQTNMTRRCERSLQPSRKRGEAFRGHHGRPGIAAALRASP